MNCRIVFIFLEQFSFALFGREGFLKQIFFPEYLIVDCCDNFFHLL